MPRAALWTGLVGTLLLHGTAVVLLFLGVAGPARIFPPSYAVELVAAPAASAGSSQVSRPIPEANPAPPVSKTTATPKPAARNDRRAQAKTSAPARPLSGETPSTGADLANVKFPGKEFPFPEYLRNLVNQIYRRWNRPLNNSPLTAEVGFVILRDGTVRDIKMVATSRSYSFDQEALGAIESAALAKAFGSLPTGYQADYLQISFIFKPGQ